MGEGAVPGLFDEELRSEAMEFGRLTEYRAATLALISDDSTHGWQRST